MYDTIDIESFHKPAVALVNSSFALDARSAASGAGMPGIRIVPEEVPCESRITAEIEAGISAVMDDVVAALLTPLTPEEKSPKPDKVAETPRVVFKGSPAEVNRFFYERGWTDGLPITLPTGEAVAEMMAGTDLPPDHVVGKIIPRGGKASVEKIAVNAVMAGALPTYMPLLIAGVQAMLDPLAFFGSWGVSTGSWAPCWIVNGGVRQDLNVNNGSGALSPGDIANAAIGRAMGLIIKNIGGARKGVEDMGVLGNPGKYSMVVAENEEESPWEPLHVQQGFKKEDSTVTLFFPNCYVQVQPYGAEDKGILNSIIYNILPWPRGLFCLILPPVHAKTLANRGWKKKEIASFISEFARVPAYRHGGYWKSIPEVPAKERVPMNPEDSMRILLDPDWIRVIVAGGPGNFMGLLTGGSSVGHSAWVTKEVILPENWDELVAKYRNIVPKYLRY
ncbi:MAG: hypothetical protein ABID87_07160 [Chloroflexota bacterium]